MSAYSRRSFLKLLGFSAAAIILPHTFQAESAPFRVYLTFDDGPTTNRDGSGATTTVLDILRRENAPATFFLHGIAINSWESDVLVRMLNEGHAIGNHLWQHEGNTIHDEPSLVHLAEQYIWCERRIRQTLAAADVQAYQRYLAQPRLFRRPGGNNGLNAFLDPKHFTFLANAPSLRPYRKDLAWLKSVYDYSGWHLSNGDSSLHHFPRDAEDMRDRVIYGYGGAHGVQGYLCTGEPPRRAAEIRDGLIILMHDAVPLTQRALPLIIAALRDLGATFHALPRPNDQPNVPLVGIGYPPTPDPLSAPCTL
ncbi:MAG: polysaccharide deacetylase family protein [Anaerolineae bacterium]|nr:polysaccharide deacetylase family protein [Anaerolineae bacterium]MDW8300033.1 polysaccharide deacetylase family protein [Anaerolineae bacterium]